MFAIHPTVFELHAILFWLASKPNNNLEEDLHNLTQKADR